LAAVIDLRTRHIPNALTGALAVIGVGIAAAKLGPIGLGGALLGCALGLAFMLPGHVFGATGAGDVKLLAAVGAVVGPGMVLRAFVLTAVVGGVFAVAVALRRGRLTETVYGTTQLVTSPVASRQTITSTDRANRFAYGPAIAIGTLLSLMVTL
jgi:prepilin peptidase CpaA